MKNFIKDMIETAKNLILAIIFTILILITLGAGSAVTILACVVYEWNILFIILDVFAWIITFLGICFLMGPIDRFL